MIELLVMGFFALIVNSASAPVPDSSLQRQCRFPPDSGMCWANFTHWYYDAEQQKCLQFFYHGCEGNLNRFDDEESCMQKCGSVPRCALATPPPLPSEGNCTLKTFTRRSDSCKDFYIDCPKVPTNKECPLVEFQYNPSSGCYAMQYKNSNGCFDYVEDCPLYERFVIIKPGFP